MLSGVKDVANGLARWQLWTMLAWEGFRARYHRTFIGPIWVTASFMAFLAVKIFIFGAFAGTDTNYFVGHVAIGFMVWTYISNAINAGSTAFIDSRNWILGIKAPYSLFIFESVALAAINLFFVSIAALVLTWFYVPYTPVHLVWSLVGIFVVISSLFWVQLLAALLTVFMRDLAHLTATVMRIAFFMTPIIWLPSTLGTRSEFVNWNPFMHYIALVRAPLLDGVFPVFSYAVIGWITVAVMLSSIVLLSRWKPIIAARV